MRLKTTLLPAVLALLIAPAASAVTIGFDALEVANGDIEVISPGRTIVYWYAYDPFGNPIFLYGDGVNVGNRIEVTVYFLQGMVFGDFSPAFRTGRVGVLRGRLDAAIGLQGAQKMPALGENRGLDLFDVVAAVHDHHDALRGV